MSKDTEIAALEGRVAVMQEYADRLWRHIEAHEFDHAAIEAAVLELYCKEANMIANRIADRYA